MAAKKPKTPARAQHYQCRTLKLIVTPEGNDVAPNKMVILPEEEARRLEAIGAVKITAKATIDEVAEAQADADASAGDEADDAAGAGV